MKLKLLTIFLSLIILIFVVELIRKEKLTFKYAFGWILVSVLAVFFAIFDKVLFKFSDFIGFELHQNNQGK